MKKVLFYFGLILLIVAFCAGIIFGMRSELSYEKPELNLNLIKESGRLGVLSAHVNILNSLMFGPSSNPDYMKLYGQEATAIYYVDLSQADISEGINTYTGKKTIFIRLDE